MTSHRPEKEGLTPRRWAGWGALGGIAIIVVAGFAQAIDSPDPLPTRERPTVSTSQAASTGQPSPLAPEPTDYLSTQLSVQTCARIAEDQTSEGVWNAAAALETGPNAVSVEAAWAAVSTFVAYDCDIYSDLVARTIEEVTG